MEFNGRGCRFVVRTHAGGPPNRALPLSALQELGGWESAEMVRRYSHLAADHLAPYAERLCAARAMGHETVARFGHSPETARACRRQALDYLVAGARYVTRLLME